MTLKEFKDHISAFEKGKQFKFGLSSPFSWRGVYAQVAFELIETPMTREEILANIELAYTDTFKGYKGGEYNYNDFTQVNFEEYGSRNFSDGIYTAQMIGKIEGAQAYPTQEHRLVLLAFS